ncbi:MULTISPECIES: hypothetical protein [unclassified Nocardioides]|uniref:hypothetical protein n=1 Tax=unclassified Nocardioides TaxID=2615069 RepID=UPI003014ABE8
MTSADAPGSDDPAWADPEDRGLAYGVGAFAGVLLAAFASMQLLEGLQRAGRVGAGQPAAHPLSSVSSRSRAGVTRSG